MAEFRSVPIPIRLHGVGYPGTPITYSPDASRCVHGIPAQVRCEACVAFNEGLVTPSLSLTDPIAHLNADPEEQIQWATRIVFQRYGSDVRLRRLSWHDEYLPTEFQVEQFPHSIATTLEGVAEFLLMACAGLNTSDPQEQATPARYVRALKDMTTPEPFEFTVFEIEPGSLDEMVVERNITFSSLCRHHVLPFVGKAHIGYIPRNQMAGISKLARAVRFHAAGLRTQEELTIQIGKFLEEKLDAVGVAVALEAEHMCMTLRGVRAPGALTSTQYMGGVFGDHTRTAKVEFLDRINHGH